MRCEYNIQYCPPQPDPSRSGIPLELKWTQCARKAAGLNFYGRLVCLTCAAKYSVLFDVIFDEEKQPLTFAKFSETNRKRCESPAPNGFGESLADDSEYDPEYFAMAAGEEVGEVIGAVLGANGKKKRKKHFTKQHVFDEIGDAVACLDLLAQRYGGTLEECIRKKFNEVSDRLGGNIKL